MAWGYVVGIADALDRAGWVELPERSTQGQLADIVLRYLDSHPERLHERSSLLIAQALEEVFPGPVLWATMTEEKRDRLFKNLPQNRVYFAVNLFDFYRRSIASADSILAYR